MLDAVAMVDGFIGCQRAPKMLSHHAAMLQGAHLAPVDVRDEYAVARIVDTSRARWCAALRFQRSVAPKPLVVGGAVAARFRGARAVREGACRRDCIAHHLDARRIARAALAGVVSVAHAARSGVSFASVHRTHGTSICGVVWRDDAQVVDLDVHKRYGTPERCEIVVRYCPPPSGDSEVFPRAPQ